MDIEEIIEKWIMVSNQEFISKQEEFLRELQLNPYLDKEAMAKIKRQDVPFPHIEQTKTSWVDRIKGKPVPTQKAPKVTKPKFDPQKAWEEAPEYDLKRLKALLK